MVELVPGAGPPCCDAADGPEEPSLGQGASGSLQSSYGCLVFTVSWEMRDLSLQHYPLPAAGRVDSCQPQLTYVTQSYHRKTVLQWPKTTHDAVSPGWPESKEGNCRNIPQALSQAGPIVGAKHTPNALTDRD